MSGFCGINQTRRRRLLLVALGAAPFIFLLSIGACLPAPPNGGGEPIFPADYRSTFVEVRDCRLSIEHASTVRIWVNDVGADAYLAEESTLPEGTVVVKEEFAGADCSNDADLLIWSVMRKEPAGFDAEARDWRFQEVAAPSRRITIEGKATCIVCHTVPECLDRDLMCTEP